MRLPGALKFGRLDGKQVEQFQQALLDAFSTLERFDDMLLFKLSRQRQHIALGNSLETIVVLVVQRAEDDSWTAELLQAARTASPNNPALLVFAQRFGLAPATPLGKALEHTIRAANGTPDVALWRARLGEMETRVCAVEVDTGLPPDYGTAFLVGPDIVMTNYHVVEAVIKGQVSPKKVALRFDYKKMVDGATVHAGVVYRLADKDWLLDSSPYNPLEILEDASGADPRPDELDYALLRVAGAPGDDPIGGNASTNTKGPARKWIELPITEYPFAPKTSLFILQHPAGEPLKLALETQSVVGLNGNKTRVCYTTNTQSGSSGSPCFDGNWNLIALHHAGDPRYEKLRKAEYNQGIPFTAIVKLLDQRGKKDLLGEQTP